jgi:outer membrane protein assembly factor BamD (BamD/ComL family)
MKTIILILTTILVLQGCATINIPESSMYNRWNQNRKLATARDRLAGEEKAAASSLFSAIVAAPPEKGITDEALFHLALLQLKPTQERDGIPQAQRLLERLQHDFPTSPWSTQAAQLLELFNKFRSTKEHSFSLLRENRELRQSIQKLKEIDLELEQKRK